MIAEEVDARKETVACDHVWDLIEGADKIHVASGKKTIVYEPGESVKEEVLKKATGRTGNLRAPALKIGNEWYIGFSQGLYEQLFG